MKFLDLTLPTAELNLALDEALLQKAEDTPEPSGLLRLWESPQTMVVLGRASKVADEVHLEQCRSDGIPVFRRCSGGTSIVAGPGCLMYAVILSYDVHPELKVVDRAHQFVMSRMRAGLAKLDARVQWLGSCDLTIAGEKFSGNSLRCKRRHLLYHGTVLYEFDLTRLERWLRPPPRQPAYRAGRDHGAFVTNFGQPAAAIRAAIQVQWQAEQRVMEWPRAATEQLAAAQYAKASWNYRL